jgi:dihydropteroate synthase
MMSAGAANARQKSRSAAGAMEIVGIVNITRDSFSDGGQFFASERAVAHARRLVADGAAIVDLGAESTHPDAEDVPADEEIARLMPVLQVLRRDNIRVSVDTYKPAVMRAVLNLGVEIINDVTALRDPQALAVVRNSAARVILMHSTAASARAERLDVAPATIVGRIVAFFERRIAELEATGIPRQRLILDPGMGFFLGRDPAVSLSVLRNLDRVAALGLPVCVSTSRKSFIAGVLGGAAAPRPVEQRGAGTLATELWAAQQGVKYIRTHDVRALRDALVLWSAIVGADEGR